MLLVIVLCSLIDSSCLEHQIPLNEEVRTPQQCAIAAQPVLAEHMQRYPNHRVRRTVCADAAHVGKNI